MTEQQVQDAGKLIYKRDQGLIALAALENATATDLTVIYSANSTIHVPRDAFCLFLRGQIQSYNLQLHYLGITRESETAPTASDET